MSVLRHARRARQRACKYYLANDFRLYHPSVILHPANAVAGVSVVRSPSSGGANASGNAGSALSSKYKLSLYKLSATLCGAVWCFYYTR
jgi:hypothetical protein